MSKIIFYRVFNLFFFFVLILLSNAQNKISVKATVDKNKILIGQPLNLTVEADFPAKQPIRFFIDTFPHFEFLEKQKIDTSASSQGTVLKQTIQITSFDSGHWVIPSFVFAKKVATDSIPVDVVFSDFDPKQDYHDIKEIIEVNPPDKKNWLWYIIGSVVAVALILILVLRKKKPVKAKAEPIIDPYEEAMRQLELVKKGNLLPKEYFSKLVDTFRLYIFKRKGIMSLQKTTDDLIIQLKVIQLDHDQYSQISQSLRLGDFVKFARYEPTQADKQDSFNIIKNSIETIERQSVKTEAASNP